MYKFTTKTIREIAVEMPQTTRIFEEFKIDYCCGGRKPFAEACELAGVNPQVVSQKIENALKVFGGNYETGYAGKQTATDLIDYILEKHHVFTKQEIERLTALMEKVCRKHGAQHAELFDLQATFQALGDDLTVHMRKEETVLFPFIKTLEMSLSQNLSVAPPHFRTVRNPVRMIMLEHDTAGGLLRKMRELSNDFSLPDGACPSFGALYFGFRELEKDLHRHIHLENNVLFPQAVEMEQKVFGQEVSKSDIDYACQPFCS